MLADHKKKPDLGGIGRGSILLQHIHTPLRHGKLRERRKIKAHPKLSVVIIFCFVLNPAEGCLIWRCFEETCWPHWTSLLEIETAILLGNLTLPGVFVSEKDTYSRCPYLGKVSDKEQARTFSAHRWDANTFGHCGCTVRAWLVLWLVRAGTKLSTMDGTRYHVPLLTPAHSAPWLVEHRPWIIIKRRSKKRKETKKNEG
ncbi:hypothetical protein VTK73DRAFT_9270 [Phialemonium thermophilum]|uniref:Uncharacterized protein n=1 Tax=Phialemonium thermophilum TaxID=223376 RepID=A0ABR3W3I0_9PEZI